jgi:hypothetical protein
MWILDGYNWNYSLWPLPRCSGRETVKPSNYRENFAQVARNWTSSGVGMKSYCGRRLLRWLARASCLRACPVILRTLSERLNNHRLQR